MKRIKNFVLVFSAIILLSCAKKTEKRDDYPVQPVPFTDVQIKDDFWAPRIKMNHEVTIPIAFRKSEETGRVKNFKIAGGLEEGKFCSVYPFDDSDVFKIIEGASYSLQTTPDPVLEAYLDSLIYYIGLAQEEDGYLYTYRTIMGDDSHSWIGSKRWEKTHILSHELYNLGHMYEAAVAFYQATGKRNFLEIAIKSADLVANDFGWGKFESYPGHQEIEIGLVKLYRVTGDQKYLDLAMFFLDVRGPDGEEYSQSHKKVTEQDSAVGHSVRAVYMYSGMADVAALTNDQDYVNAISNIWEDIVYRKMYVTGGIGAAGGNEGFAEPYNLPNMTAYCETCASIANVFWNHRMFLHHGEAKYYDVLERTLYNALLSGVSLSGDRFFYPNRLESNGQHQRQEWFGCACCPSNITRFLPSIPGYIYAQKKNNIYVNLFVEGEAQITSGDGVVKIKQETGYPWDGEVKISINPEKSQQFTLHIRVPGWAQNQPVPSDLYKFLKKNDDKVSLKVNGKTITLKLEKGYAVIKRKWKKGDIVEFEIPMPVRRVVAHENVEDDLNKVAIQKGPIVYCIEGKDHMDGHVLNFLLPDTAKFTANFREDMLNGIETITTTVYSLSRGENKEFIEKKILEMLAIPYYSWANRGPGEMMVWIPGDISAAGPLPAPTIASTSRKEEVSN